MKFVVESTGVAHGLSVLVAPPKRRRRRLAVRTARARPPGRALETLQYRKTSERQVGPGQTIIPSTTTTHVTGVNLLSDLIG